MSDISTGVNLQADIQESRSGNETVPVKTVLILLLLLLLVGALEIPDWLLLIIDSPLPTLGREAPYWLPILCLVLVFNLGLINYSRRGIIKISPASILFGLFVVVMLLIELGHTISGDGIFNGRLVFSLFWMFVFYVSIRLFNSVLDKTRSWVAALSIALIVLVSLVGTVLITAFAVGRGGGNGWLVGNQLYDSTYLAYLSLLGATLVLFEWPFSLPNYLDKLIRGILLVFWIYVIHIQRLVGPELILISLIVFKLLCQFKMSIPKLTTVGLGIVVAGVLYTMAYYSEMHPTMQGLMGGLYLFDEIGHVHGDVISSYIRKQTLVQALQLFNESPVWGAGMDAVSSLKVITLGLHSSLVYIIAAAGLVGLFPLVCWMSVSCRTYWKTKGIGSLALIVYLLGVGLLIPSIFWWFSIIIYLFVTPPADRLGINDFLCDKPNNGK